MQGTTLFAVIYEKVIARNKCLSCTVVRSQVGLFQHLGLAASFAR